jgi:hypothetical protein
VRHGIQTNRLGKPADQRKALIRSLTTDVLTHGKVKTTVVSLDKDAVLCFFFLKIQKTIFGSCVPNMCENT